MPTIKHISEVMPGDIVRYAENASTSWSCYDNFRGSELKRGSRRVVKEIDTSDDTLLITCPGHGDAWFPIQSFEVVPKLPQKRPSKYPLTMDQVIEALKSIPDPKLEPLTASKMLGCLLADLIDPL